MSSLKKSLTVSKSKSSSASAVKPLHPLLRGPKPSYTSPLRAASKTSLSDFTQRVMSGKLLQMHQLQNDLNLVQGQLRMFIEENRSLKRIIKRQEIHLRRYDGEDAAMPRLLRAHAEEIHALRSTLHEVKVELRQVRKQLQERDEQLMVARDTLSKYKAIVDEKNLLEHEKTRRKLSHLQHLYDVQSEEIQVLSRKILLEAKNHQRQLAAEVAKHRRTKEALSKALETVANMKQSGTLEAETQTRLETKNEQIKPPPSHNLNSRKRYSGKQKSSHGQLT